jgi:hypothetical protein
LKLEADVSIEIDYDKFNNDKSWDGLRKYITDTNTTDKQIVENH